jgi:hypothetical protein
MMLATILVGAVVAVGQVASRVFARSAGSVSGGNRAYA